ncbi:MAG: beta-ketoacyl reductase, partial [Fimbriiglobus sp.]
PKHHGFLFRREWVPAAPIPEPRPGLPVLVLARSPGPAARGRVWATPGTAFRVVAPGRYELRPDAPEDYESLIRTVGMEPLRSVVLHDADGFEPTSLLWLIRAAPGAARVVSVVDFVGGTGTTRESVAGIARTAGLENSAHAVRVVGVSAGANPLAVGLKELAAGGPPEVRWVGDTRLTLRTAEVPVGTRAGFRRGGVYLLSGGLGEVGRRLAVELARRFAARLVVIGRRPGGDDAARLAAAVRAAGGELVYCQADVTDERAVSAAVANAREKWGGVNGVLHLARAVRDGGIRDKSPADVAAVCAPKLAGTAVLDRATAGEPLDFFVLFSSLAGWRGLAGGADYAYACAAQDRFAEYRAGQVVAGSRAGRTVSIAWPQWEYDEHLTPEKRAGLGELGLSPLDAAGGIDLIEAALGSGETSVAALVGDPARVRELAFAAPPDVAPEAEPEDEFAGFSDAELRNYLEYLGDPAAVPSHDDTRSPAANEIRSVITDAFLAQLKLPADKLGPETPFADLGLDSISALRIAERIRGKLGVAVDPRTFFEYPTLSALSAALDARRTPAEARP